jgi:hypothetical protein
MREEGRIVGGEGWQEKVHNREEWKKLLRTARNRRILHVPVELMNEIRSNATIRLYSIFKQKPLITNEFSLLYCSFKTY